MRSLLGWTVLFCLVIGAMSLRAPAQTRPAVAPAFTKAAVVALHGEVDDLTGNAIKRGIKSARAAGAKTIILDFDTPGGLVVSALDIARFLRRQDDLHIIAYIDDKAYSAGALIAVSCNEIVMKPSAVIGDCAPIVFNTEGQLQAMPPTERAKASSPVVNDFDASADRNGYSRTLLEAMVMVKDSVYWIQSPKTGKRKFVDKADYEKLTKTGWTDVPGVPVPIDGPSSLLTLQTNEAVKIGLAKGTADSIQSLAAARHLTIVADYTPTTGDEIVELLSNGAVRGILLSVFLTAVYLSLSAPGHGAAEAVAVCSLGLLVGAPLLTGYAQWWEVAMIFAGLGLVAFEIFVFPGHGVSIILGSLLLFFGLLLTFVGQEPASPSWLPAMAGTWMNLRNGLGIMAAAMSVSLLLVMWLRRFLPQIPYFNRLILTAVSGGTVDQDQKRAPAPAPLIAPENLWPGVGTRGKAATDLRPGGSAEFFDFARGGTRAVAVISEQGYVNKGQEVIVREANGSHVVVQSVDA